jgi:hypothetical protein
MSNAAKIVIGGSVLVGLFGIGLWAYKRWKRSDPFYEQLSQKREL